LIKFSEKQIAVIREIETGHRINALIGPTRSGKSHIVNHLLPRRVREMDGRAGLRMLIAKTLGSVESNILIPCREMFGVKRVSRMRMQSGLMVAQVFGRDFVCMGGDNIRAVDKLRGKAVCYALGDEVVEWPEELWEMLKTRMPKAYCRADLTGNPRGPQHFFKKFLDRAKNEGLDVYAPSFSIDDNPTLTEDEKEHLRRSLTGLWYKRLILGLWVAAEGAVYDMLDENHHHVRGPAPRFRNYCLGVDFGLTHPTAACLLGWDRPTEVFQVSEWGYSRREGEETWTVQRIEQGISGWLSSLGITGEIDTYLDPSAAAFKAQLRAAQGKISYRLLATDNSQADGLPFMQTAFTDRRLKLYIDHCKRTWEQLCGLAWDGKATERGKDAVVKNDDDWPDALRYAFYSRFGKKMARAMDLNL
jgi:PBSX family phage terminase large subunit